MGNRMLGGREQRQIWIFFLVFYCNSPNGVCPHRFTFEVWNPFRSSPQNWDRKSWLSSHLRVWRPTDCLYLVTSPNRLTPFLFSIPRQLWTAFLYEPIKTRCRFAADTFIFLSRASLIIVHYQPSLLLHVLLDWCRVDCLTLFKILFIHHRENVWVLSKRQWAKWTT